MTDACDASSRGLQGAALPLVAPDAQQLYPLPPLPWPLWLFFTVNLSLGALVADRSILLWAALLGLGLDALVWLRVLLQARRFPDGIPISACPKLVGFETGLWLMALVPIGWLVHALLFAVCKGDGCPGVASLAEMAAPYQPFVNDIITTFDRLGRAQEGRDIAVHALLNIAFGVLSLGVVAWRTTLLIRIGVLARVSNNSKNIRYMPIFWILFIIMIELVGFYISWNSLGSDSHLRRWNLIGNPKYTIATHVAASIGVSLFVWLIQWGMFLRIFITGASSYERNG